MPGSAGRERRRPPSRGQTETVGVVLVLGMTLIGATVALGFGGAALNDARVDSQEEGIQHAMTQLDSRSAMVALGDSSTQYVHLGAAGEGSYRVVPDAGWVNITHRNYDGSGNDAEIYNESLGALVYERDDTVVAYQGGGVWRAQGGNSTMVSPPEFHYQSATLTFPVIQLEGDSSIGGSSVTAKIGGVTRANRIYPNESDSYPSGDPFANPVREGNVTVTVHSEYYQAWASYFRTRTSGEVTVYDNNETVHVKLLSQGTYGDFEMPADGNSLELQGISDGHPFSNFTIFLRPDDSDSANFANLQWSLWAEKGSTQQFEIHLRDGGENTSLSTAYCTVRDVQATIYYSDSAGDPYHGWYDDNAFNTECKDFDGDGDNETYLEANLTGPSKLEMQSLSMSDLQHFNPSGTAETSVTFNEHDGTVSWEAKTFSSGDQTTMYNLTNHYLQLMGPDVELHVEDKGSDTVNEDQSSGSVEHSSGGTSFITFLHITENRVKVELE